MLNATTIAQTSFYDIGGHMMYFIIITAHICLFIDESPLQKYPLCFLNLSLAILASAAISSFAVELFTLPSFTIEILFGIGVATVSSLICALTFQRVFNVQWNL